MKPTGFEYRGPMCWNIAFEDGRTPWGHVLAFAATRRNWVVVDPHIGWTEVYVLTRREFDDWILDLSARATIYRLDGRREAPVFPGVFCVGTIKRLIGLRSGALSPGALRRDLVRAGARQVFTRESQNPQGRPAD